ncbi:endonuclease/exonuclease/phosphatase family protein [Aestuariibacter halophilus]|uniref:Endonuclease/exonuclease/phosphatase family protein n=1 Tax=Fluctibacter halophilus TaxID=226011 RepID=A0ABS8G709_9ALTE|nr:endonuclease/exonuclease/phosphatase family protein [Aestuariibacter halophilus]MCC2616313.1 endonuclease/exonuclease/phosphatase family protein [Aestuariibacter halophilus]
MKTLLKGLVGLVLLVGIGFTSWVYLSTYHPADVESEAVHNQADTPTLLPGQTVKVLSWNVQFMAGNQNNHFFYDDGPDPWPDKDTVTKVTDNVAAFIQAQDPDIVLLQEMDDEADRTHLQDQTQMLLARLPQYTAYTETFYWKADYVPHPAIAGRVGMKLLVLSKYALSKATRYALPAITTDDIVTRQFNLKRAMLQVHLPVEGSNELVLINTHLSAFAQGSDTMARQIDTVMARLASLPEGTPWVMGGDFNLLPNDAALASYTELRSHYNDQGTELYPLITQYPSVPSLADIEADPSPWYTYMSPLDPARTPDRTIDYIFHAPTLEKTHGAVLLGDAKPLSDHLPIVLEFTL